MSWMMRVMVASDRDALVFTRFLRAFRLSFAAATRTLPTTHSARNSLMIDKDGKVPRNRNRGRRIPAGASLVARCRKNRALDGPLRVQTCLPADNVGRGANQLQQMKEPQPILDQGSLKP